MVSEEILRTHLQELRRGTVVVASLVALRRPDYGYALLQRLTAHGFPVDANTLYPLLRRLEEQGLLTSEWNTEESRPRKFYRVSAEGETVLDRLLDDLAAVQTSVTGLIEGVDR
ncbi:PadR family transcriptional regulator [Micromonospora endolithica]|uniref:PadR family transcriptional regulator n=1 Tax=Micromonospora endolithica TaxID=230091 RepID=A0A3A9YWE0_9ACTN|nr:PadR family transcriptional regulator [Micromonospora endolithica]RKN40315.1 PadR family transcriptional regulator [Micromonospora endolithica]TWJ22642.1 transcriptional regulator, PadR family [Micromonospora endolithica]